MNSASAVKTNTPATRRRFEALVALREEWRKYHEHQDRENADRVFREAGIAAISDLDLKFFPELFRAKLNEFGRDWERALAAEALREGFSFYRIQFRLEVDQATRFHAWVQSRFQMEGETVGAPLFFESNGLQALQGGTWDALFYFVLRSGLDVEILGIPEAPGITGPAKALKIA